ncbi:NAD(P)-dependent dehydrogenase (short-subunit alcohol dehydrogenase family) [Rhizobium leguminosarum]|uniref:NAD(P)-dependent dehydrogenase (Short-subunit alcohol dehydrogenase family) n=1 Tax=Rhizobium leguminosarum TaxID=384 RepID=A0AAE2MRQ1_RHILE|nr:MULTISPECIES: SDR family NAD(P)-dependent oxidoreductase [Rhizobium]MBB4294127.1 NAD(P)-dependent dehydrogenase (short-subunit alcohol dehydrogenase family) [Rhizobium leguminosarum]MBB4300934.1 NAD(P)-dependent dehydrogenase (short-subunit alcohol dehydrogenase family) [Rhizobium leguminosarum]MBB4311841.1 NAD(P)-dependent dehydrogenase (short-subunit alcohol dehydrogenase family) [Rhizobium leguminosarum]MBB4420875.1 NAD(P)-dependent dehydrogenase (short-subunit alcohol dehydrogenase famil
MSHKQHPIGSGFAPASTADDVLAGIDLTGRNVVVTGGHAGIGLEVTRALTKAGASVVVGARNPDGAAEALRGLFRVEVDKLDLIDPSSIDAFAARWLDTGKSLHILVNNAAASGGPERDARGYETQFATNHLGHFQLTLALLPALRAARGARVVNVSSGAHRFGRIRWEDPNFTTDFDSLAAYAQSKTANVLFAVELDRRYAADGIRGYAVHPGVVAGTKLNSAAGDEALRRMGLIDEAGLPIIDPIIGKKTPAQGASTIVFASASPLLDTVSGVYLMDNDIAPLNDEPRSLNDQSIPADAASHSIDPHSAKRLWDMSKRLLRRT